MSVSLTILSTVAGAVLGAGLTYLNAVRQKRNDAASALWKNGIDRRSRQLGELYAPLRMLRAQSMGLRSLLPSVDVDDSATRWRLVHHAGTIGKAWRGLQASPPQTPPATIGLSNDQIEVAHLLMTTGDEACALIDTKAGLIDGGDPGGFREYKDHHRRLKLNWDSGIDQAIGSSDPFQGDLVGIDDPDGAAVGTQTRETSIDVALDEDLTKIRADHEQLLQRGPETKGTRFGAILSVAGLAAFAVVIVASLHGYGDDEVNDCRDHA